MQWVSTSHFSPFIQGQKANNTYSRDISHCALGDIDNNPCPFRESAPSHLDGSQSQVDLFRLTGEALLLLSFIAENFVPLSISSQDIL
jgi:hypothetical protein